MKPRGVFPAIEQAAGFMRRQIRSGAWRRGERLPSIRDLALAAGVSDGSMFKAAQLLKKKGLIAGGKRRRIVVGSQEPPARPQRNSLPQWQKKRIRLETDIISGAIARQGRLPPLKALQSRYGVCFGTMKKVVRAMEADGIVVSYGKGYAVPEIPIRSMCNRIVFITLSGHFTQESALNHEHNRIVNLFENECLYRGLSLEVIELDFYDPAACRHVASSLPRSDTTLGFILDVWWYDPEGYRSSYLEVFDIVSSFGKPVALLDELGGFSLPVRFAMRSPVQVYSIERSRAGERVARFLQGKGHKSVVYISPFHDTAWSQDRFAGISAQFARTGHGEGVHLAAGDQGHGVLILLAASGLDDRDIRKLISLGRTPSQAQDLERQWRSLVESEPSMLKAYRRNSSPDLRKNLSLLKAILASGADDDFLKRACDGVLFAAAGRTTGPSLEPFFESSLRHRGATAWICANDGIAFEAMSFLRRRGIRVPSEISIVGFDNVPDLSLQQRLTTLDFNAAGFVHQMLGFISRPHRPRGVDRRPVIEVEGIIVERGTTAKAPPAHRP